MLGWRRVACAVALVAAVVTAVPASRAATTPPDLLRFFKYNRPAQYETVRRLVRVPMRDGVHIGCYLTEPAVPGRYPGIINNFSPYFIAYPIDVFHGAYFASRGYLDLQCLPRGTGVSEGVFPGWLSAIENRDNYDLIEWLAHRPNANGKVGQHGNSYGGMTAYRVASLHPPSLVAIAPQQSYASLYTEFTYPGGIRSLGDPYWWVFAGATGFVRPMVSPQEVNWLLHPLLDAYWQQIDIAPKWSQIDIPVLGFGGWVDIFQDGMVRNHLALAGPNTYLIDGPWEHSSTFDDTVTEGALLAWFDRWLYGNQRAPLPPTHVSSYRMPSGPWQSLAAWPPPGVQSRTAALGGPDRSYIVNTAAGAVDLPGDHAEFTIPAAPSDTTIGGAATLRLAATITDPTGLLPRVARPLVDTNFVVRLYDVAPSGAERLITRGYLKASHRQGHASRAPVPLGQRVDYTIDLWHTHYRVPAGHRLSLVVRSGDRECCLAAAPAVTQPLLPLKVTINTSASALTLPVL